MKIFLAGIMQGSHLGAVLHRQDYRTELKRLLTERFPHADVYDPLADHSDSLDYDETRGRATFYRHNRMCRDVDLVVAFVPEASMGTAIEIWEAYRHGRRVVTISPLCHNWAVRYCSDVVYDDFDAFAAALRSGDLDDVLTRPRPALVP